LPGGIALPQELTSPDGLGSTIQMLLMLAVVSLAPAVLMMTTCFVRIVVVLGLLRQSLGGQQMAPNQVITALALFMSLVVMSLLSLAGPDLRRLAYKILVAKFIR
jgi:flagellar biosynthetic protein FliP